MLKKQSGLNPVLPGPKGIPFRALEIWKLIKPVLDAAEEAENAPGEVTKDMAKEKAIRETLREQQQVVDILNSHGLYLPWQEPPKREKPRSK